MRPAAGVTGACLDEAAHRPATRLTGASSARWSLLAALALVVVLARRARQRWRRVCCWRCIAVGGRDLLSRRACTPGATWCPARSAVLLFIVVPIVYSLGISFTNYSSNNLLSFERAHRRCCSAARQQRSGVELRRSSWPTAGPPPLRVHRRGRRARFVSEPVTLGPALRVPLQPDGRRRSDAGRAAARSSDVIALQTALRQVVAVLPDGTRAAHEQPAALRA